MDSLMNNFNKSLAQYLWKGDQNILYFDIKENYNLYQILSYWWGMV